MTPFEAYCTYQAVKRHFAPNSKYDFHKYGGKLKLKASTFDISPQRFQFDKLSRHPDLVNMLVANLSLSPKIWVGDLSDATAHENYLRHMKIKESLSYFLKKELSQFDDLNTAFIFTDDSAPAYQAALAGELSLEVLAVIDAMVNYTAHWEKVRGWDPSVKGMVHVIRKLSSFIDFDADKTKIILKEIAEKEPA